MTLRGSGADLLLLCAGLTVWASAFLSLYALLSLGCAYGWEDRVLGPISLQRAALVTNWSLHLALNAALVIWARRRARQREGDPEAFLAKVSVVANIVALLATFVNFSPLLPLSTCL
ncbi:hypothetical protein [Aureimonas jatrophae]|uniref:Uncharacterized protein n=1 Tax=Aureimonas jatrophae TaxID=1166073 RepID=A0A1H0LF43_9HYPH|nr:hypothetical protein [Aureimonas jatrophae]MBB3952488.1 hypothetical protein [Aureimonas jatrophae]SDO66641.1 hypothetical protein SAMN05192530_1105 [Aureimonas jatrophae]